MADNAPFFSIIIPTYNRGHLLDKTITSVLAQDYPNYELLVIDDGSTDDTSSAVKKFHDTRIRYFRKENGERGAARNFGQTKSRGIYVNFLDSDDLLYPHHLRVAKQFIEGNNNPEFFHLSYDFRMPKGEVTRIVNKVNNGIEEKVFFDNFLSCNGVFVRRKVAEMFPFQENRMLASAEDWELWIRLMSHYKLYVSNEVTSSVIGHDQRSIRTISTKKIIERDLLLIKFLSQDEAVQRRFGRSFRKFKAQRFSFFMLCCSEDKKHIELISWALKAIFTYPLIVFSKRFLASLKNIF